MNIFIVIAAYNEEKNILNTIKDLETHGYKNIIVIDDGSKDSTFKLANSTNATVLRHLTNCGQGATLQTGNDFALLNDADIIVHFDGDGQHKASEIRNLIIPIINEEVQATLGSRFLNKSQYIPCDRKLVLKGGMLFHKLFYDIHLTDAHNGFRALSREAAQKVKIKTSGMEHSSEIVHEIMKKRIKYKEVPVTIKYSKEALEKGQSNLNAIKIVYKLLLRKLGV